MRLRLRRRKRTPLAPLRADLKRDRIRSGALVSMVSYEVWEALSLHDRDVLLRVDDCMAGRYGVAELRRRLYATALCVCGHPRGVHGMPGLDETFVPVEEPDGSMAESPPCMAIVDGDRCPCVQFEAA